MENSGKVIKPPVAKVVSGKIFKPTRAFLLKSWVKNIVLAGALWAACMISFVGMAALISYSETKYQPLDQLISQWWVPINLWIVTGNLIWLVPTLILKPFYVGSIEYSVKSESGETMPEIYVKKGIITVTRKHVPFRTITNIASEAGPFDRLFGIGNVSIETAGYSGTQQAGPEEKLEGVVFYEEVRDFILNELRRYRTPYTTATEPASKADEAVPRGPGLDDEILITLREIRDTLRKKE